MNTNEKKESTKKKKKKKLGTNSFSKALIPDARLAVSICSVSLSLSLSLTVLSLPPLTLSLTFPLEFLWQICKFILLPLGSNSQACNFNMGKVHVLRGFGFNLHTSQCRVLVPKLFSSRKNKTENPK